MSTDTKLSEAQISKIIQLGESLGSQLTDLGKKARKNVAFPLPKDNLPVLASNLALNAVNKFETIISGKVAVRAGKGFTLFMLNEDMNSVIKVI